MSRPRKPPLTEEELAATAGVGAYRAAWEISRMRGGMSDASKRVGKEWVRYQRKQLARRPQTPGGRKPRIVRLDALDAKPAGNGAARAMRDPERHQERGMS